jgi:molecular chaperone GrpE
MSDPTEPPFPGSSSAASSGASSGATPLGPGVADELMSAAAGKIEALEAEAAQFKDKWLRAEAESQNIVRRMKAEVDSTRQYAVQKFARDMVEAAENFSRALASLPEAAPGEPEIVTKFRDGLSASERALLAALDRNGVTMEAAVGKPFDPEKHQAMAEAPSPAHPAGTVLHAYTPTWLLHGRLLKAAMVVVSSGQGAPNPATDPPGGKVDTAA